MERSRLALFLVATATASCSLFVSLDDLQQDEVDTVLDGSSTDVAVSDAHAEASIEAADAGSDADARPAVPYCDVTAKGADYCNDFDDVDAATATWSYVSGADGTFALEQDASVSVPSGVEIVAKPGVVDPSVRLGWTHSYSPGPTTVTVHLGVRFVGADASSNVHFLELAFDHSAGASYTLELTRRGAISTLVEGVPVDGGSAAYFNHDLAGAFAGKDWIDVVVAVDFKAKHVVVTADGAKVYDAAPMSGTTGHLTASIGIAYFTGKLPSATDIQFDDFAVFHE